LADLDFFTTNGKSLNAAEHEKFGINFEAQTFQKQMFEANMQMKKSNLLHVCAHFSVLTS